MFLRLQRQHPFLHKTKGPTRNPISPTPPPPSAGVHVTPPPPQSNFQVAKPPTPSPGSEKQMGQPKEEAQMNVLSTYPDQILMSNPHGRSRRPISTKRSGPSAVSNGRWGSTGGTVPCPVMTERAAPARRPAPGVAGSPALDPGLQATTGPGRRGRSEGPPPARGPGPHTRWEPRKQEQTHKKSGWSKLLRSCRAALDVLRSVEAGGSAIEC